LVKLTSQQERENAACDWFISDLFALGCILHDIKGKMATIPGVLFKPQNWAVN